MDQGEQGSTKNEADAPGGDGREPQGERAADPPPAAEKAAPERVDWTALLEERALVPDSEPASPVAVAEEPLEIPRQRGLLYLVVAVVALFSVVASAAVVIALLRGSGEKKSEPSAKSAPPPAAGAASAAAESPPAPMPPRETPPAPAPAVMPDEPAEDPAEPREDEKKQDEKKQDEKKRDEKAESRSKKSRDEKKARDDSKRDDKKSDDKKRDEKKSDDKEPGDEKKSPDPDSPAEPSAKDLASAIDKVKGRIETCAKENGVSGMVAVRMQIEPSGSIGWSAIREGGDTFQSCVGRVLKDVRVPASQRGGILVHNITLPAP